MVTTGVKAIVPLLRANYRFLRPPPIGLALRADAFVFQTRWPLKSIETLSRGWCRKKTLAARDSKTEREEVR